MSLFLRHCLVYLAGELDVCALLLGSFVFRTLLDQHHVSTAKYAIHDRHLSRSPGQVNLINA